jgi:phosphoserine phosphatase
MTVVYLLSVLFLATPSFAEKTAEKPAAAKKRPKNFRLTWKNSPPLEAAESAASTASDTQRLMGGRWKPEVRSAIDKFIAERGKTAIGYNVSKPPVAVLPWSDALVAGDPAELVFLKLATEVAFRFEDEWWEIVPIVLGRQPARAAYDNFISLSSSVWNSSPDYHRYRKTILSSYLSLCSEVGRRECRQYLMRLWAGWKENDAVDYAKQALTEEKLRPAGVELILSEQGDKAPLRVRRGLRLIPEMRDLAQKLRAAGMDVWVVDDVPQPVLAASAPDYGVDPSRIHGVRAGADGTRLSAGVLKPVPTRGGKAEIVKASVGRPADFVLGRDLADLDVLSHGDGLRVVLSGDKELEATAKEKGWLIQPSLVR